MTHHPSRRGVLIGSAAVAGVVASAASGYAAGLASDGGAGSGAGLGLDAPVPFHGAHQAGIVTPAQDRLHFVALDVVTTDPAELAHLLKRWARAAER